MRTVPVDIPANAPVTGAQLFTYAQAIRELQSMVEFSYTWALTAATSSILLDGIPPDLAVLELTASAGTTDATFAAEQALHGYVNENQTAGLYPFRYTYISGNPGHNVVYSEKQPNSSRGYFGVVKASMPSSVATTSQVVFSNWGVGSDDLCYAGNSSNMNTTTIMGGHIKVPRPYTSIRLFPAVGQLKAGSVFTLHGRWP